MATKTIIVFDASIGYDMPSNPKEFFAYWQEKLDLVPEEYRDSASFDFDLSTYYDSPYLNLKVTYQKKETLEEKRVRLDKEAKAKEYQRDLKIIQLNRLKQELGL